MRKSSSGFKKRFLSVYIVLLFLLVYGTIVYLYPRERKFAYEFQRGAPWTDEDLIANYDFPIYKSNAEIEAETDSVRNSFNPYYLKDTSVPKTNLSGFRDEYRKVWSEFRAKEQRKE